MEYMETQFPHSKKLQTFFLFAYGQKHKKVNINLSPTYCTTVSPEVVFFEWVGERDLEYFSGFLRNLGLCSKEIVTGLFFKFMLSLGSESWGSESMECIFYLFF